MMWVEFKAMGQKWKRLSFAPNESCGTRQMFGWMFLLGSGGWRIRKGENMIAAELIDSLRKRQAKLDAPSVLDACELAGVAVESHGDSLKINGPLTDGLRSDLKRCKPEIIAILCSLPPWDDAAYKAHSESIKLAYAKVKHHLHPAEDDVFSIAGRNVLADAMAAIERAHASRRIDLYVRRCDWLMGWFATLDSTLKDLRTPGAWAKNRQSQLPEGKKP